MSDETGAKRKPFHRVVGLTDAEYRMVRGTLIHSAQCGKLVRRMARGRMKRLIMSALYCANAYGKALRWAKLLSASALRLLDGGLKLKVMGWRTDFELKDLYLLRAEPAKHCVEWNPNKARAMLKIDSRLAELASAVFPGDQELGERVRRNQNRWGSKRLPGVARRHKTRRKPRKKPTEKEPKQPKEYVVDETLFTFESM